jgi:tyrosyl-tRNA synthetase
MEGVVKIDFALPADGIDITTFLADSKIFPSKGEARKMIHNGGISINRKKVESLQMMVENSLLLHQKYLLIQKGKKNYYLVKTQ